MADDNKPFHLDYAAPPASTGSHPRMRQFFALFCAVVAALIGLPAIVYSMFVFRYAWTGPGADFAYGVQGGLCLLIPGLVCLFVAWRWGRVGFRGR